MKTLSFTSETTSCPCGWVVIDATGDVVRTAPPFNAMRVMGYKEDVVRVRARMLGMNVTETSDEPGHQHGG